MKKRLTKNSLLQKISDLNFAPARPRVVRDPGIRDWFVKRVSVDREKTAMQCSIFMAEGFSIFVGSFSLALSFFVSHNSLSISLS